MNHHFLHHWLKQRRAKQQRAQALKAIDTAIYAVAVFSILVTIPQVIKVWFGNDVSGVSLLSWSGYLIVAVFWLAYGILHRDKPLIFANVGWVLLDALVVIGVILHS